MLKIDEASAAVLYQTHAKMILRYLRNHTQTQEDAGDLLQDTFLAAFRRGGLADLPPDEQAIWLRQVAHHRLVDLYRHTNRHPHLPLEDFVETEEADDAESPEAIALHQEEQRRLHEAVQQLPAWQQEVLRLRFSEGLRSAQIAQVLGKGEGAVRMLLSRTLNRLRTLYGER